MERFIKTLIFSISIPIFLGLSVDPVQKKVIRTKEYDIEFYVSLKKKRTNKNKEYFWYKSGEIHNSIGNAAGELLHLQYVKYYADNSLAERGEFEYGLKKGVWKQWYPNGVIMEESRWVDGVKYGPYSYYNEFGELVITGKYRDNNKIGVWINLERKDTTWYKKGRAFKAHPRIIKKRQDSIEGKKSFFKKIFGKRDSTAIKEKDGFFKSLFGEKKPKSEDPKVKSNNKDLDNEPNFFQRIFGKQSDNKKESKDIKN